MPLCEHDLGTRFRWISPAGQCRCTRPSLFVSIPGIGRSIHSNPLSSRLVSSNRETDDLKRQLRDAKLQLDAEERRFEAAQSAHQRELAAAVVEGEDARGMANDLKDSLEVSNKYAAIFNMRREWRPDPG